MKNKLPRQVVILSLVSLFTDVASEMLYPVTPIFLTTVLGTSMAAVGIIEGLAEVTAGLLKGYFGFLSDKIGKRSVFVMIGYGLSAISKPLPGLLPHFSIVLFSRISDRIGKGIRTAPRDALLASYAEKNTGAVFGFHRGMDTLGAAIGPILSLILLGIYPENYTLVFLIAFIPSVIAMGFTFLVKDKQFIPKSKVKRSYSTFWQSSPLEYKRLIVLLTIFSLVNSSDVFLILKSRDISQSSTLAIAGYIFYNLVYAAFSYPAGILSDKFGKKKIFVSGLLIFSLVYFGFGISQNVILMWVLFALYGIYASATEGIAKAWVSDLIPNEYRSSAIGLLTMLSGFAVMLGSVVTGFLWDQFGSAVPFYISSAVSFIICLILMKSK